MTTKTRHKLLILLGPTAVGKTDLSVEYAQRYASPIISCDSRQLFREMKIGTAVPSDEILASVQHYFIRDHSIFDNYNAGTYETEALALIEKLFAEGHDTLVMTGGSGFYIDAVCKGFDSFPDVDPALREELSRRLEQEGVESLRTQLLALDPETYASIDLANGRRIIRALEVCLTTGRPYSSLKTHPRKPRPFEIEKIGLTRPRAELYARIDRRVLQMMDEGLLDEVRSLLPYKNEVALRTVGYQELFPVLEGEYPLERGIELVQRNTRRYAKRQMTWFTRDNSINWIEL